MFYLLLSLLIGKVWAALMHAVPSAIFRCRDGIFVQLDFGAAFYRVSHSGLLFNLKSIGVGGIVLSICIEFFSNRMQRVVLDDANSKRVPIVSGTPHGSVLCPLLFILFTGEMFELVKNRLPACADDSTIRAVVRRPADRPAVAASLNRN